jgi:hypothetical protein
MRRRLKNPNARHDRPALYSWRLGNPFAAVGKFSGKTASTGRQIISNKKSARSALSEVLIMPRERPFLAK